MAGEVVATDIPTRHKAGIWGGGIIGIIALIIAIVALLLALLYFPKGRLEWSTVTVTPSGGTASVSMSNNTVFEIAGPATTSTTITVTLTDGKNGNNFVIANTAAVSGGSLIVGTGIGNVEIKPGMGVGFVKSDNRTVPLKELMGVVSS